MNDDIASAAICGVAGYGAVGHTAGAIAGAANLNGAFNLSPQRARRDTATAARSFRVVAISNGYLVYTSDGSLVGESAVATYVPDLAKVGELVVAQMAAAEMDRV